MKDVLLQWILLIQIKVPYAYVVDFVAHLMWAKN